MKSLSSLYLMGRMTGIWPSETDNYYMLKQFVRFTVLTYLAIGLVWYSVELWNDPKSEFVEILESIFTNFCYLNLLYSYWVVFLKRESWIKQLERLTNFDKFGQPTNISEVFKRLDMLIFIYLNYFIVAITSIQMNELIFYQSCQEKNHVKEREVLCGFLIRVHYSYNIKTGILWYLHFIIPAFGVYTLIGGAAFAALVITAAEMIIVRIDHLNSMIIDVFNAPTHFEQKLRFRACCVYHQYIIQLGDECASLYLPVLSPMPLNYSILIGIQLLSLNEEMSMKPFINLLGWIGGTFFLCFCSERLAAKSVSTAAAIYEARWYEADVKLRRDMLIMMIRAQKPTYLTLGFLGMLSNETFKVIMKGSYTYATLRSKT